MQWIDAPTISKLLDYPSLCTAVTQAHREPPPVIADLSLEPLVAGTGDMAGSLIEAFTALRPSLRQVRIWNRSRSRAEKLAADLQIPGVELTVVDDLDAALPAAEVSCAATMSDQPLIRGAQVAPGTHA
ncbi:hypothetical protein [Pseudomonas fluorescens]|uniref:hypothetical protein n=1 Tax=Pseudomonas fluorescens TaxID=294 RepID=UPI0006993714|nr:hypothetical protein [Pseudomonas fluorescens]